MGKKRILEDAEIKILRKVKELRVAAMKDAAPRIADNFKKMVFDQAVRKYYTDYDPTKYKRTESLYDAFYTEYSIGSDGESFSVSGKWDFNRMQMHESGSGYHEDGDEWISRKSSKFNWDGNDNGIPENGWIFTNFMEGIHPRFYLSRNTGMVVNASIRFEPSYLRIKEYAGKYKDSGSAQNILLRSLKRQLKNK